ncbi:hypothetical protein WH43_02490 [Rheinheimera sp. KL1]|uniref:hypothetical protein n=1 Tax=Rheinheimera sp. KL1 TaxID=1635005 RepID=UPI0006A964F6|nr:hypothetical protein [Rheinheimera sp. KL1]KOO59649.1 hypothetical protein WH43_02490 [Rheinheimera sp. KL1]
MARWTIEDQENCVKAAISGALFFALLTGFQLLRDISLFWFELKTVSDAFGFGVLFSVIYFLVKVTKQPGLLSYGWKIREICGDFQDEYLRSRFQRATTLAFHLMLTIAFAGYAATNLINKHGDPQWISFQLFPLLTIFIGTLSFYLSLRTVLDEQDETAQETK